MSEGIQYSNEKPELVEIEGNSASQLPEPCGFRLLIALPEVEETTAAGIYIPDERRTAESVASIVGFVLKSGEGIRCGVGSAGLGDFFFKQEMVYRGG